MTCFFTGVNAQYGEVQGKSVFGALTRHENKTKDMWAESDDDPVVVKNCE